MNAGDPALEKMAGGAGSGISRGGMQSKVIAAKRAARSGANTIIASGHEDNVLVRLSQDEAIGTRLLARIPVLAARKQWLADYLQVRGMSRLIKGQSRHWLQTGKNLLSIGVISVEVNSSVGSSILS